jgi:hypothetical protein
MRRLAGICVLVMGAAGAAHAAEVPQLTTTPSFTATPSPTVTPTPTFTPIVTPSAVQTPAPTPFEVQGAEIFVNEVATSAAHGPAVAASAGGFVVAWTDDELDNGGTGIFARRFDRAGSPLGGDFQVNTTTTGVQYDASVASDAAGNFVVVWASRPADLADADVYARRFDASGTPLGADFRVNTYTTGDQTAPRVASNDLGNFVVVWTSVPQDGQTGQDGDGAGIFAQQFDTSGNPVGAEVMVNESTTGFQVKPAVATQTCCTFMVVWQGYAEPGRFGVFGRRFDSDGTPSPEFLVTGPVGDDQTPDVGAASSDFVIAYEHTEPGDSTHIFGRIRRDFDESFVGNAFRIDTEPFLAKSSPRVGATWTAYRTTGFVVVWESSGQDDPGDGSLGIYAQRFDNAPYGTAAFFLANPHRKGSEYQVNSFTTGYQAHRRSRWTAGGSSSSPGTRPATTTRAKASSRGASGSPRRTRPRSTRPRAAEARTSTASSSPASASCSSRAGTTRPPIRSTSTARCRTRRARPAPRTRSTTPRPTTARWPSTASTRALSTTTATR